jgi:hypothetical protein
MLRARLRAALRQDRHAGPEGRYRVSSLYFDTPTDTALRDKINGVDGREKFRIRRYNDDFGFIQIEKKSKQRGLCTKRKEAIGLEELRQLLNGDRSWMMSEQRPLALEFASKMTTQGLRPTVIVEYVREAFTHPAGNVRITLDSNLHTSRYATDFLSAATPLLPLGDKDLLLEVKYDAFIPEIITGLLGIPSRRAHAFSKYAASRIYC